MFKKRVENRNFAKLPRNVPSFAMILELEVRTHYITHVNLVAVMKPWDYHRTLLMRWSFYKYKCLWGVGGKSRGSSLQEKALHTHKHLY